ncbi:Rab geranylgeranyltransferase [Podospora pseudopauciseta]|uniref:Rab geranylgeranyltransferase n=2 Tax=Podospora TaxID=5144 RepID=A0ABR0HG05_9PEZI|nr:Rab geranylgeranyltransferase [Podospora pseudopauciseta]KAK4678201.1 Rab geranylgeranyltransferase [Podospora pseudoanserina]
MADQGGSQHGIARTTRTRTPAQKQQDLERIQKYRDLESHLRQLVSSSDYSRRETFDLTTTLLKLNPEYYTAYANFWLILKTVGWVLMLEGVLEFFSVRHYNNVFRRVIVLLFDKDPAQPSLPEDWEEWYNS